MISLISLTLDTSESIRIGNYHVASKLETLQARWR